MKSPIVGSVVRPFVVPSFAGLVPKLTTFKYVEPPWIKQLEVVNRQFQSLVGKQFEGIARAQPFFMELARVRKRCELLEATGWLPHHTTPFDLINRFDDDQPNALAEALDHHYTEAWPEVRKAIEGRFVAYRMDEESQASFREALSAHELGLYRACSRTLFPELERVVRTRLKGGDIAAAITSQHDVREGMMELGISNFDPGGLTTMALVHKMADHVYAHVKTEDDLARAAKDSVPNRHVVMHGLGGYASRQGSFNCLAMADFIVQVVAAMENEPKS